MSAVDDGGRDLSRAPVAMAARDAGGAVGVALARLEGVRVPGLPRRELPREWVREVLEEGDTLHVTVGAPGRPVDGMLEALRQIREALADIPGVRRLCVTWLPGGSLDERLSASGARKAQATRRQIREEGGDARVQVGSGREEW